MMIMTITTTATIPPITPPAIAPALLPPLSTVLDDGGDDDTVVLVEDDDEYGSAVVVATIVLANEIMSVVVSAIAINSGVIDVDNDEGSTVEFDESIAVDVDTVNGDIDKDNSIGNT